MKSITTFFASSTSAHTSSGKSKKPKKRSMSRSDTPSFGSSTSSGSSDSFTRASAAPQTPRSVILGRNASCLDAEYLSSTAELSPKAARARFPCSAPPEVFCVFNREGGSDKVTKQELEVALRRLVKSSEPPTEEEVAMMLAEVDQNGDGCISLEDLVALGSSLGGGCLGSSSGVEEGEAELRDAFGVFDADGDGKISAEELQTVFLTLGDAGCTLEDCRRMIGRVASRDDGFVRFEDFVRMMDGQR